MKNDTKKKIMIANFLRCILVQLLQACLYNRVSNLESLLFAKDIEHSKPEWFSKPELFFSSFQV